MFSSSEEFNSSWIEQNKKKVNMTLKIFFSCKKVIAGWLNKMTNGQHDTENWFLYPKNVIPTWFTKQRMVNKTLKIDFFIQAMW